MLAIIPGERFHTGKLRQKVSLPFHLPDYRKGTAYTYVDRKKRIPLSQISQSLVLFLNEFLIIIEESKNLHTSLKTHSIFGTTPFQYQEPLLKSLPVISGKMQYKALEARS